MAIKTIIFDVGNVLFRYEPQRILDALLPKSPDHETYLRELIDHDRWQRLDRGDLTLDSLKREMLEARAIQPSQWSDIETIVTGFVDELIPIPETIQCFSNWDYPIYILSNFQDQPFTDLCRLYPFLNNAKGQVVSARVGHNKPEPEIYQVLLDRYQIEPKTTLFIDDLAANIAQAQKMGIQGLQFQSVEQFKQDLSRWDIPWPTD